ncbi:MAG: hypothetical protein KDB07_08975 [Planctomycetes bacterium]|nr:hypothetical protein [Planctomycetota bacterium]
MKMTLVNSRSKRAAKRAGRGAKSYVGKVKKGAKAYGKTVGLAGVGAAIGLAGSQYAAQKLFGNDASKSPTENAQAKAQGQMIMRTATVALGLLVAPASLALGVGLGVAGLIGLGRTMMGKLDKDGAFVNFAQEGVERDYGDAIQAQIDNEANRIVQAVNANQPQLAGLTSVQTSAVMTREPTTIL